MKKHLYLFICLLSFCLIGNAKAEMLIPQFDVYVSNQAGAEAKANGETVATIPYNTELKLLSKEYDKSVSYVMYEGNEVAINNSDITLVKVAFDKEEGYKLSKAESFKVLADNGLSLYSGPSDVFYSKVEGVTIPKNTEIEYEYIDNALNTDEMFVYVTYNGISGWARISIVDETVAFKKQGLVMIINPDNVKLATGFNTAYANVTVPRNAVVTYEYLTKYKYYITYEDSNYWLSIINMESLAYPSSNNELTVAAGDIINETYNGGANLYTFDKEETIKPLFYYNNYYYIEHNGIQGWVNVSNVLENDTQTKIQPTAVTPTPNNNEPKEEDKSEKSTPKKLELILVIGLGVILLLSLTSLIALMFMNKKGGKLLESIIVETEEEPKKEEKEETDNKE